MGEGLPHTLLPTHTYWHGRQHSEHCCSCQWVSSGTLTVSLRAVWQANFPLAPLPSCAIIPKRKVPNTTLHKSVKYSGQPRPLGSSWSCHRSGQTSRALLLTVTPQKLPPLSVPMWPFNMPVCIMIISKQVYKQLLRQTCLWTTTGHGCYSYQLHTTHKLPIVKKALSLQISILTEVPIIFLGTDDVTDPMSTSTPLSNGLPMPNSSGKPALHLGTGPTYLLLRCWFLPF